MMTHAYSELYLNDAKECLADMLDYAVNDCGFELDWFASLFVTTGYAQKFESGNPAVLSGMSGVELAREIIRKAYKDKKNTLCKKHQRSFARILGRLGTRRISVGIGTSFQGYF